MLAHAALTVNCPGASGEVVNVGKYFLVLLGCHQEASGPGYNLEIPWYLCIWSHRPRAKEPCEKWLPSLKVERTAGVEYLLSLPPQPAEQHTPLMITTTSIDASGSLSGPERCEHITCVPQFKYNGHQPSVAQPVSRKAGM